MKFSTYTLICALPSVLATCDPLTSSSCSAVAALGTSFKQDWSEEIGPYFTELSNNGEITFSEDDGISLTMTKQGDNPTIQSNFYIMFGKVEVVLKAANGTGIISSFYMQSDDLDEIDIELFGGDDYEFQSNYFIQGNTTTYDRGAYHPTSPGPVSSYHTYTIDWNPDVLTWSLDGSVVRTLTKDNAQGFPQTPMQIIAGVWAGGDPDNEEGTIEWAGGETDFTQAPFSMSMKSIIVSDYSSGTNYSYSGTNGTWESIVAEGGEVDGREEVAIQEFSELELGSSISQTSASTSTKSSTKSSSGSSTSKSSSSSLSDSSSSSGVVTLTVSASTSSNSVVLKSSGSDSTMVGPQATGQTGSQSTSASTEGNTQTTIAAAATTSGQTTGSSVFISTGTTLILTSANEAAFIKSSFLGFAVLAISYLFV